MRRISILDEAVSVPMWPAPLQAIAKSPNRQIAKCVCLRPHSQDEFPPAVRYDVRLAHQRPAECPRLAERRSVPFGEVAERLNVPVSKTGVAFGLPWVRIPPSPLPFLCDLQVLFQKQLVGRSRFLTGLVSSKYPQTRKRLLMDLA